MNSLAQRFALSGALCAVSCSLLWAKPKLAEGPIEGIAAVDLPVPHDVTAVVVNKSIAVSWQWDTPDTLPNFADFGFEVRRNDGRTAIVQSMSYTDFEVTYGTYTYTVRVRGRDQSRKKGKLFTHVSQWSEPARAEIELACPQAPSISLNVEPTKMQYASIPSLRLHLTGSIRQPAECRLTRVFYSIDSGTGILHSGNLKVDAKNRFDEFVDALRPEDEVPGDGAIFTVTVTAENEAGPSSSGSFDIKLQLRNPYAPRDF